MLYYSTRLLPRAQKDLKRIHGYMKEYNFEKVIERVYKDIENLKYMPRMHKTIFYYTNPEIEYRRIVSGKYVIIYKIEKNEIIILRIFNQKENYLNQKKFILREEPQKYIIC